MKRVFLVFCEGETEETYLDYLKQTYRSPIRIVPKVEGGSIELWFLLHGKDKKTKLSTEDAFNELLKMDDCWAGYEKAALTDTQKAFLWEHRLEATERARKLKVFENPSSGIFNLILALEKSLKNDG